MNPLNFSREWARRAVMLLVASSLGSSMPFMPMLAAQNQLISQGSQVFMGVPPKTTMEQIAELKKKPANKEAWLQIRSAEEAKAACELTGLEKLKLVIFRSDGPLSFVSEELRSKNKELSDEMEVALENLRDLKNLKELELSFMEHKHSPDRILKQVSTLPNLKRLALYSSYGLGLPSKEPETVIEVPTPKAVTDLKLSGFGIAYLIPATFPWEQIESLEVDDVIRDQTRFNRLVNLKKLKAINCNFNEQGLAGLSHARNLEELASFRNPALLPLGSWRHMKNLRLSGVRSKAISEIGKLKELQQLELTVEECTDADLEKLGQLPQLESLYIGAAVSYDKGKSVTASLTATGAGLAAFEKWKKLKKLHISGLNSSDDLFAAIGAITSLTSLSIYGENGITQSQVKLLNKLTNLENVHLPWAKKTMELLQAASTWRKLKSVYARDEKLNDSQIEALANFPGLEHLYLSGNRLTDKAFDTVSKLQRLQNLNLSENPIEGRKLDTLALLPNLTDLQLNNAAISDEALISNPPRSNSVTTLGLANNKAISGPGLSALSNMTALQKVDLGGTCITDSGLKNLQCRTLEFIGLGGTDVTEHGIEWLSNLPNLKSVNAHGCGIKHGTRFPKTLAVASQVGWYSYDYDDVKAKQENKALNETFIRIRLGNGKISELAHHERAEMYKSVGEYKNACEEYDKAIDDLIHPKYYVCSLMATGHSGRLFDCYDNRGMSLAALGEYDKALSDLNKAVEMAKASAYARTHRGYVLLQMGKTKEALKDLDRAIDINPKIAAAYQYRSEVYKALGNDELAKADAEKSKSLGYVPELPPAVREAVKDIHRVP